MKAIIYFNQFLKDDGQNVGGGGIGTLISLLCPLLEEMGHQVTVYQCAGRPFDVMWGATRVVGVPGYPGPGRPNEKVVRNLREIAIKQSGTDKMIEVFAGDFFSVKNDNPYAICVQNGLAWDSSIELLTPKQMYHGGMGEKIFRYRCQLRGLRRFETCYNRVAVDLYFLNWYRSFRGTEIDGRLFCNPNPAPAAEWDTARDQRSATEPVRIIFARRLVPEKGTRVIAEVFSKILKTRPNIQITVAGEGIDEGFLRTVFAAESRVKFTVYRPEEALDIHRRHDVAVIPSLCGEATCLAVLEGMAAGCAVLATNMGGMITQILDGYNGLLCSPDEASIINALLKLIDDHTERILMQKNGWATSQKAFPIAKWQHNWRQIINSIVSG